MDTSPPAGTAFRIETAYNSGVYDELQLDVDDIVIIIEPDLEYPPRDGFYRGVNRSLTPRNGDKGYFPKNIAELDIGQSESEVIDTHIPLEGVDDVQEDTPPHEEVIVEKKSERISRADEELNVRL